jgi:tetratricopeptide (TPR) repeat protein
MRNGRIPAPGPSPRKPAYYEAITIYETGVRALQRRDFTGAADHFRSVIQRFPDERELLERARLYLQVCERETANRAGGPATPQERVYAATVALNAGDADGALTHLKEALADDPENDYGHYIMAIALSDRGKFAESLSHLRRSIEINPENRSTARLDPDLAVLRETDGCRDLLDGPPSIAQKRPKTRR